MAEFEQVEERLISGKGVLRVPESALDSRVWILYLDVIRPPSSEYKEFNWSPPQSLYARLTYLRAGYVQTFDLMRFNREQRTYINDITGQNLRAIKCAYEGTLQTFFNLGNALSLPSISITNLVKDYESLSLSWDEIRFVCYGGTALQARFFKLDFDACNPDNDRTKRLPPPLPPLPLLPPNTPIGSISLPYDENDDDTEPFDGDQFEEEELEPPGEECVLYNIVVRHGQNYGEPFIERAATVYGQVLGVRIIAVSGVQNAVQVNSRGFFNSNSPTPCAEQEWRTLFTSDSIALSPNPEIVLFEPYNP